MPSWSQHLRLPAVRLFLAVSAGILLAEPLLPQRTALLAISFVLIIAAAVFFPLRGRHPLFRGAGTLSLLLALAAVGALRGIDAIGGVDTALLPLTDTNRKAHVRGIVDGEPADKGTRSTFILRTLDVAADSDTVCVEGRVLVTAYHRIQPAPVLRSGDTVRVTGKLASARPSRNPGAFDYREYLAGLRMTATMSTSGDRISILGADRAFHFPQTPVAETHRWMRSSIDRYFPPERAPVMAGLLLGDRGRIADEVNQDFKDAGIIHILAVSGLHVGILLTMIWAPLGRMRPVPRALAAMALLWFYALLTGVSPPVLRAVIMATIVLGASVLQRAQSSVNTLALAGAIILLVAPEDLRQPGFQLSFVAVLSLQLLYDRCRRAFLRLFPWVERVPVLTHLVSLFAMTLTAQMGTLPLLVMHFGQISLVSFIANLIAVPLSFVAVAAGMTGVLASAVSEALAVPLCAAADAALAIVMLSSSWFAALPCAVISFPAMQSWVLLLYVAGLIFIFHDTGRVRHRATLAAIGAVALLIWATIPSGASGDARELRVTCIDVGQGDAILVELPAGRTLLVDAGPSTAGFDSGDRTILPFLRLRGIDTLDGLLVTHPDDDHIGGASAVISGLPVRTLYRADGWADSGLARRTMQTARARGTRIRILRSGDMLPLGPDLRAYVLSPDPDDSAGSVNDESLILNLRHGRTGMLFSGDAEADVEMQLVRRYGDLLRADLLKVGHHGSGTSSCDAYIAAVRPSHAVISCGRNNRFNHPKRAVVGRLQSAGARIHRTDIAGACIFVSDGRSIRRITWNDGEGNGTDTQAVRE